MKIEMAHGGGGAETNELIRAVFAKHFHNEYLEPMGDAAVLPIAPGKIALTTDAFVVRPLVFPGGDIGRLAVCGTVNDLLMSGAQPKYLTAAFAIEEGMETDLLDQIAASMREACDEAGVKIVAGDTKVIEGAGGLIVTTAGVGEMAGEPVSISGARPGDAVIVSGDLGDHHACILSARMGIENGIRSDNAPLTEIVRALRDADIPVHAMRDVTRGGLATILNEIADASRCAVELSEAALPVARAVRGLCAILGLDPLYMGNEGKLVAAIPETHAEQALSVIRASRYGENAARVGAAREGRGVSLTTHLGGRRTIPPLRGEGLPRIC